MQTALHLLYRHTLSLMIRTQSVTESCERIWQSRAVPNPRFYSRCQRGLMLTLHLCADMNTFRSNRCCRATCTRIADAMGLRRYVVTHGSYRDLKGGRVAADSMVAETLEVRARPLLDLRVEDGLIPVCPTQSSSAQC